MTDLSRNGARVLLIATGTHHGPTLPTVPSVQRTFEDLRAVFLERCGVASDRLRAILDPPDAQTMALAVTEEVQRADTVLLVYFIGHGLLGPGGELYLAASSTDRLVPGLAEHQALAFSSLRQALGVSRASSVVVVLDCCFSGRASLGSGLSVPAFTLAPAHGLYLIGSAEQLALAPPNATHTAFTGALIDLLTHGDPRGPHQLTLDAVYDAVFRTMRDQQRPLPRRQAGDRSGNLVIAPNPAAPTHPQPPQEEPQHPGRCPYPGLDAFGVDDAEVFHGRERMTGKLLATVAASAGEPGPLVLVGPSGSGKTSLLNAGLLAALRHDGLPGSAGWPVAWLTPGTSPLSRLAAQLGATAPDTTDLLREDPARAVDLIGNLLAERPGARLIVLVDQLEELFTLCPDPSEPAAFLEVLTAIATPAGEHPPPALVVLALRADFYGQAAQYPDLLAALRDRQVLVEPMTSEELRAAIEQPATSAGLVLDDGLADLIMHELGATIRGQSLAGALPLLSHVLWATWRQRAGARLTVAAYRAVGGIAQAIATTAEHVYSTLDAAGQDAVQRMLPRLVRVSEDTADTAQTVERSALLHGLPDPHAAHQAIDRLTEARLLTLDRDSARISHEALLHAWPRLRDWVDADRDWLRARQQLANDVQGWERSGRDPSQLYRGKRLAAMQQRIAQAPAGISELAPGQVEFMDTAWRHERRGVRLRRLAVALLVVLSLVAGGLAVWAETANQQAQRQLRIAHSRSLAEDSLRFRDIDPRMALQLAQAAWHTAPTSEAYGALFTQYAALQPVEKLFQGLWQDDLGRIMTGPDGSVAAIVNEGGLPSVWAGLNGDDPHQDVKGPQPHRLPGGTFQLSPSGRLLGYASSTGHVAFWDLERRSPAVLLRDNTQPTRTIRSMAFSPDETRLLIQHSGNDGTNPEFELWDLAGQQTVPVAQRFVPEAARGAFFGPTPNTVLLDIVNGGAHLFDLATGRLVGSIPEPEYLGGRVAQNGAVWVQCGNETAPGVRNSLQVHHLATGASRRIPVPSCGPFTLDTTTNYVLETTFDPDEPDTNGQLTITDLRTGHHYLLNTPNVDLGTTISSGRFEDKIAVFTGADGHPVVLAGKKNLLYRQRPHRLDVPTAQTVWSELITPQGDLGITTDQTGTINLIDLKTNATVATATGSRLCQNLCSAGRPFDFSLDGTHLLVVRDDTLVVHAVPSLTVERRIRLPVPQGLGGPPSQDGPGFHQWGSSVGILDNDQVTILHAGMITRWNLTDGRQIGIPTQIRPGGDALRRSAHLAVLEPRPRHPEQAIVIQPSGGVELWHLDRHRIIASLDRAIVAQGAVRFNLDGSLAAVYTPDRNIQLWNVDVDPARLQGRPIPVGESNGPLGFTPDDKLITISSDRGEARTQIWDQDTGRLLATLTWPATGNPLWGLEGNRLVMIDADQTRSLELDPKLWFDTLCRHNNRDFTDNERAVLAQLGAPDERPCG